MKAWADGSFGGRLRPAVVGLLWVCGLLSLGGCLVQRRERIPPAPLATGLQKATLDELLEKIRLQQEAIHTLDATVQIEPSVSSASKAEIVHYRDVRAFLLIRKPAFLRMIGQYPVVRNTAFDLASDGEHFGLSIPSKNRFITGNSKGGKRSQSAIENLRPQHILDALLWRAPEPDQELAALEVAAEGRKSYYIVHILRRARESRLWLARKLWFERAGLTLERLQIFDENGELATDARYSRYGEFSGIAYAQQIVIHRPQDEYGLILSVERLEFNQPLGEEKFRLEQPQGAVLIQLEETSSAERASDIG